MGFQGIGKGKRFQSLCFVKTRDFAVHAAKIAFTYWQESAYQKNEAIPFGFGTWIENGEGFGHTFSACVKKSDGSIHFKFILADTPFIREVTLLQNGDFAEISIRQNVGFQPVDLYLIGKKTK